MTAAPDINTRNHTRNSTQPPVDNFHVSLLSPTLVSEAVMQIHHYRHSRHFAHGHHSGGHAAAGHGGHGAGGAGVSAAGGSTKLGPGQKVTGYVNGRPQTITVAPVGNGKYLRGDAAARFKAMQAA